MNLFSTLLKGGYLRLCVPTFVIAGATMLAFAQTDVPQPPAPARLPATTSAPVTIDGKELFPLQGIPSYPADERAGRVAERIRELAGDPMFSPDQLTKAEDTEYTAIMFGNQPVMMVHDLDASAQGVGRTVLAGIFIDRISTAVRAYREERSSRRLLTNAILAVAATALLAVSLVLVWRFEKRQELWLERRLKSRVQSMQVRSFQLVQAERLWQAVQGLTQGVRTLITLVLVLAYAEYTLGLFPWTRPVANTGLALLLSPLKSILQGVIGSFPGVLFIAVLALILRYLLKLLRLFFAGIESGTIHLSGFDPEWSWPTYKILRFAIVVFGVVVAYPYIPGADTAAFKGVSIFLGVVFSLGSSSAISNVIAGYSLTYRRAFKLGDRVKIGDTVGDVILVRHQVTHLRSLKNEEIIIPNSSILNSEVINYSSLARQRGLILHTTVGIGYETPWRQVEAMLRLAARRTTGLLEEPSPFILQRALGDFCVTYELNVYTNRPQESPHLITELHRNILDAFNEYGIQIMTPAYEGDPVEPKVVPKERWYEAPASPASREPDGRTAQEP